VAAYRDQQHKERESMMKEREKNKQITEKELEEEMTIPLAPPQQEQVSSCASNVDTSTTTTTAAPAPGYLPASIASWFYGTKITETVPPVDGGASLTAAEADVITAALLDRRLTESSNGSSATNSVTGKAGIGVTATTRWNGADMSDTMSVTSETSSTAGSSRKPTDKIAAKLEALRKKQGGGK
jgi:hypothetical protein